MIKIHIEIEGIEKTKATMQKVGAIFKDLSPEMEEIGHWMHLFLTEDVFATHGSIIGTPWAPLSKSYYTGKHAGKNRSPGRGILQRTGTLQAGWKLHTASDYALLNNPVPYAKYHHQPDGPGKGIIPRRPLFNLTPQVEENIRKIFKESLERRIKNAVK